MNKFKVGDRVAVYTLGGVRVTGTIRTMQENGNGLFVLHVADDKRTTIWDAHPKQCRKLVKRKRKEVWILVRKDGTIGCRVFLNKKDSDNKLGDVSGEWKSIRFIEAKKQ